MVMKRAPSAPSITRWSKEEEMSIIRRGTNSFPIPHRFHSRLRNAEDSHFRRVDNRREVGSSRAADAGDSEATTLHSPAVSLPSTRFLEMVVSSPRRQLGHALLIRPLRPEPPRPFELLSTATPMLMYFFRVRR